MAVNLQPPPYKVPVLDERGYMHSTWTNFFKQLFVRIGGVNALSNIELEDLPASDLTALTARVTTAESDIDTLQATSSSHTSTLATHTIQISDLSQGPVL